MTAPVIPQPFFWKRLHSIAGFGLVLYLMEHLFVNSQAALMIGDDGVGFIRAVNAIQDLPYLKVLELAVLGIPFFIHIVWGIKYLQTSKMNSFGDTGRTPYLPEYGRNRAYTWQRITSWILIFAVIAHVVHMRFMEYPIKTQEGIDRYFMVKVDEDPGIHTLSERLGVKLYDSQEIAKMKEQLPGFPKKMDTPKEKIEAQHVMEKQQFVAGLEAKPLKEGQMIAVAKNFGTAELFMLRETFKMPIMIFLYSLFVIAACFHAFNGLWTFMITWGVTLTQRSQRLMLKFSTFLMFLVAFLGLVTAFGTYWINLRQ